MPHPLGRDPSKIVAVHLNLIEVEAGDGSHGGLRDSADEQWHRTQHRAFAGDEA